jgi:hypothetical protein
MTEKEIYLLDFEKMILELYPAVFESSKSLTKSKKVMYFNAYFKSFDKEILIYIDFFQLFLG